MGIRTPFGMIEAVILRCTKKLLDVTRPGQLADAARVKRIEQVLAFVSALDDGIADQFLSGRLRASPGLSPLER
jgi:hypothetical protein